MASDQEKTADWNLEKATHVSLCVLMPCGVALVFLGLEGLGQIVFWLSFILALCIFAGYLFHWVILGIHGPGWVHPMDYTRGSLEVRMFLIGAACVVLLWLHSR